MSKKRKNKDINQIPTIGWTEINKSDKKRAIFNLFVKTHAIMRPVIAWAKAPKVWAVKINEGNQCLLNFFERRLKSNLQ